ncbi:hypothetical protein PsorP6_002570 [Peronosclerospora sorghi]|uniref:Uncharacterized protein n=1 Tax=Peronosclerospora sorghi TaxID=230839 RepID=A0ACC0WTR0_9STRA|nr:hypothetical protein PsorP6_002570 [Peronosclerospora sorghi]
MLALVQIISSSTTIVIINRSHFYQYPHNSEKTERFKTQGLEALKEIQRIQFYIIMQTLFSIELPNETPPIREGIDPEIC